MSNLERVQQMYAAFGRGDVQFILNGLAADVTWCDDGPATVPFFGDRRGRDQVAQFFQAVGTHLDLQEFAPREFFVQGEQVIVLGFERGRVRSSGRSFEGHWAHVFTFRAGLVTAFREYSNSGGIADAFLGGARRVA